MSKTVTLTAEQYAAIDASSDALAGERDGWMNERQSLLEERAGLRSELRVVTTEGDLYHERLKLFHRRLFAAKSELRSARQQHLFFNVAEALAPNAEAAQESEPESMVDMPAHKRTRRGRKPLNAALPRGTVHHQLSEAKRTFKHDGSMLVEIDVCVPRTTGHRPEQIRGIRHVFPVCVCPSCESGITLALAPLHIIQIGLFTGPALAWLMLAKFADGLPLYRLAVFLRRIGVDISRGTLAVSMTYWDRLCSRLST